MSDADFTRREFVAGCAAAVPAWRIGSHRLAVATPDRMAWWREARFGMFIHWGLYSILAGNWHGDERWAEWIRNNAHIPIDEYDRLVARWTTEEFDPDHWADLAWRAGMRYVVLTTKHHDGFCLWPSGVGGFDVTVTPSGRDILKEVARAFRARGHRVGWYHSIMDWHHPDYLPRRDWELASRPADGAVYARYVAYLHAHVEEILSRYAPIDILWFDGQWESTWTHSHALSLRRVVRRVAPDCLVNNRIDGAGTPKGTSLGDFGTPEKEIPATGIPGKDWESCLTMNDNWGYKASDHNWKSPRKLAELLVETASKGGNLLLNVGPMGSGEFPQPAIERLEELGTWMAVHGELIRGSTASRFTDTSRFRSTTQGDRFNLFVHDWRPGPLLLKGLQAAPGRALLIGADGGRTALPIEQGSEGVAIVLPDIKSRSLLPSIEVMND